MRLTRILKLTGTAAALALVGCSSPSTSAPGNQSPPPPGTVDVTIRDFSFSPANVTIHAGMTVRWINSGPSAHTTTSDNGFWSSGNLDAPNGGGGVYGDGGSGGGSYMVTFTQPGTYAYHCEIHPPSAYPHFVGTITVTE
jgi:plastocyanin